MTFWIGRAVGICILLLSSEREGWRGAWLDISDRRSRPPTKESAAPSDYWGHHGQRAGNHCLSQMVISRLNAFLVFSSPNCTCQSFSRLEHRLWTACGEIR